MKLSGFLDISNLGSCAKNYENRRSQFWGRGWGKIFFDPQYLPQFLSEGTEIFQALRHFGAPLSFWISRPYP